MATLPIPIGNHGWQETLNRFLQGVDGMLVTRRTHAPALGLFFPEAEGAVADGIADDAAAINAAAVAAGSGGHVVLKAGATYAASTALTFVSGNKVVGNRATIKATAANAFLADLASLTDVTIEDVRFDFNGQPTTAGVRLGGTSSARNRLTGCTFVSAATMTATYAVGVTTGAVDCTIEACTFDGINVNNVRLHAGHTRTTVKGCTFTDWGDRAFLVLGTDTEASVDLHIVGNTIRDVSTTTGDPRQPIAVQGNDAALHEGMRVTDNTIIGNGLAHHDGDGVLLGGTADAISLHRCRDFIVARNMVRDNGEVGITISQNSVDGEVTDNVVVGSNTDGIVVGVPGTLCKRVAVHGNHLRNNGKEAGQSPARTGVRAGVWIVATEDCSVFGNTCTDDQDTATQLSAIYAKDNTRLTIGHNPRAGGTKRLLDSASSGNTDTRWNVPPLRKLKPTNQTVNNSTTPVTISALTHANLEPNGVYEVAVFLPYNSSTAADLALSWSLPDGASLAWTVDAPSSTTSSPNTAVSRLLLAAGSNFTFGGTGGDAVALPRGILTMGSTLGSVIPQFAQGTAEATDTVVLAGASVTLTRIG